jgi:hypothetical protein
MCEFRGNQRIFTGVIVRTDRQTDRQADRQTEVINTFQLSLESVKNRNPKRFSTSLESVKKVNIRAIS